MRQTCILFDLDNTLVHAIPADNNTYEILIRPYTHKLLRFLYKNQKKYCIGFWSSGVDSYVQFIINILLEQYKDWPVLVKLARYHTKINNRYKFIDLDTNKMYDYPDNKIVKPISFLLEHPDYKDAFHKKKVVLIDDLEDNIRVNAPKHTYHIKEWTSDMKDDKELLSLYNKLKIRLKTHKNKRGIKTKDT